jgi:hypothetical protein
VAHQQVDATKRLTPFVRLVRAEKKYKENNMTEEYTYTFNKEQLETRAKDWWRLLAQASCEEHNSKPVLSDSDLHYIANLLNQNTRMKWLMPLIIETAIDEGEADEF